MTQPQSRLVPALDLIIELLLVALLAFGPLALGAVESWSECIAFVAGAALALLTSLRLLLTHQPERRWWVYVPVVAFILLAALQLVAVPSSALAIVSPKTVDLGRELLSDLPNAASALARMTPSLYPLGTKHDLRVVLLASSVLFTVLTVFTTLARMRRLMISLALIGGVIGAIALAQDLTHAKGIYWTINIIQPPYSGTFVNHNHFAQFMNLCTGAALGLLLSSLHRRDDGKRRVAWWTVPILILGGVTIPYSLSRGGLLSMLVASFVLLIMLARRGSLWRIGAVVMIVAIMAFAGVLALGIDRIYETVRLATTPQGYGTRLQMDKDALRLWQDFPTIGVGLGAHEWVFPAYERQIAGNVATHVENEYIQALEETGVTGFVCVIAFAGIVCWGWIKSSGSRDVVVAGRSLGLGYGLVAVMVHSLTDYGQHVPAVACASAVVCGLLINLAWPVVDRSQRSRISTALHVAFLCACAIVGVWITVASWSQYRGDLEWNRAKRLEARLAALDWRGSDDQFAELLARSHTAINWQLQNVMYRYWNGVYRWRAVTRHRDPEGNITLQGEALDQARQIIADLNDARRLCPTFGPIYWYVGQKERLFNDPLGDSHIIKSAQLAPNDSTANFLAARVHAEHNRWDDADLHFRRTLMLDRSMLRDVIDEYLAHDQSSRVIDLFHGDWERTLVLAERLSQDPSQKPLAEQVKTRGIALLKEAADKPDADVSVLIRIATYYFGRGKHADAEHYYARALQIDYGNYDWHFLRARCLDQLQRTAEARNEAMTVLRLNPKHEGAKELLKAIEKQPPR